MNRPNPDRVMDLFSEAMDLPPPRRRAFLDSTCLGEPELRRELEEMLACADGASAAFAAAEQRIVHADPERIGPYEILEPVGEGGMAIVYKARQHHPIKRIVAVKLIKLGMDTRQFVARFESERQALAMMDHPNVAQVYDAGSTETGRPYFVMEFVPGEPILQWCDSRRLPIRRRLELFIAVCEAVEHAHRKGIIHRDLKDSNVLITELDGRAIPKVIDFGVAKAISQRLTDRTVFTEQGQLIGTPQYMSPEQSELGAMAVDTRSDVYSLGVLLYELIAGVEPIPSDVWRSGSFAQVQRIIRETEPARPSTRVGTLVSDDANHIAGQRGLAVGSLVRELRRELEWIPLMAMRKDRELRYGSASELADDIRNYLEGRPLLAGPESTVYRLRKFLRRNKVGVTASATIFLLLIGGFVATTWQAYRATRAENNMRIALQKAEDANANTQEVNRFLTEDLLASAAPEVGRGRELTVREAVDRAAEAVGQRLCDRPLTEAAIRSVLADTYDALGLREVALSQAQSALDILRRAHGPDHESTLAAMAEFGRTLANLHRHSEAEPILREVVDRARRLVGPEHPLTLDCLGALAMTLRMQERYVEAEPLYRRVLEGRRRAHGPQSEEVAQSLNNLAVLLNTQFRAADAEPLYRESLAIRERLLGTDHPSYLSTQGNLARVLMDQGKLAEAEELLRHVLEVERRILKDDHPGTTNTMNDLASVLLAQKRYDETELLHREAFQRRLRVLGGDDPDTIQSMSNLANVQRIRGHYAEAEQLMRRAWEKRVKVLGPKHRYSLNSMGGLARIYEDQDRFADAEPLLRELCDTDLFSASPPNLQAMLKARFGFCLTRLSEFARAEPILLDAVARLKDTDQSDGREMRLVLGALAELCEQTSRPEEAQKWRTALAALPATTKPATQP